MQLTRRAAMLGSLAAGLPVLAARSRAEATPEVDLVAAERPVRLLGGRPPLPLWTYGADPLPVLRVRRAERFVAHLDNRLPEHTTIHWHGIRLPADMDGVPGLSQAPVEPGQRFTYDFTPPDAGTFFFHSHCNTVGQLGRGLAGVLLVEGDAAVPYDADLPLVLKDWRLDESGRFLPFHTVAGATRSGTYGDLRTVNGALRPTIDLPAGGDVRLRLLNIDVTRIAEIGVEGADAALIAVDGQAFGPVPFRSWRLGPAMRIDLVVRAPRSGWTTRLVDYFAPQPVELATFRATGPDRPPRPFEPVGLIPNHLPEPDLANAVRRRFVFTATAAPAEVPPDVPLPDGSVLSYADGMCASPATYWAINKAPWPAGGHEHPPPPLATCEHGRTELWELVNATPHQHPIHLHGMSFKVIKPKRGQPVHWADTVLLGPKDRVEVAFVADNPGDWMLHCHIVEHQETGMMGYVRVA